MFHLVHVLLLVCRRRRRHDYDILPEGDAEEDNPPPEEHAELDVDNPGEGQPLLVNGPAERGQQPAGWRCQIL